MISGRASIFLRLQTIIDRGTDPLAYRYFCLNAHYRSQLSFSWESLDGAARGLDRLRGACYELGQAGAADDTKLAEFRARINNDLNLPRGLALAWEVVKGDMPAAAKKATLLEFDKVLGLGLAEWQPAEEPIPEAILLLVERRQEARAAKQWQEADALRAQINSAGYEIEDTAGGSRLLRRR